MSKQKQRVLEWLKDGRPLTRLVAWDTLGVLEAPARVLELRREGWPISTEMVKVRNRYGEVVRIAQWRLAKGATPENGVGPLQVQAR